MGTKYFIGVDLHKVVIQVCVLDGAGELVEEKRYRYSCLAEGLEIVEDLKRWRMGGRYAVEALGLNRWFVNACLEEGLDVVVANPVKLNLRMLGKKTDRRDAYEIARRHWMGDIERNAKTYYPSDKQYGYRKLLRVRHKLVSIRQQLVNQIRAFLSSYAMAAPKGNLYGRPATAKLRACSFSTPEMDLSFQKLVDTLEATQASIEALSAKIKDCAQKDKDIALVAGELPSVGPQTAMTLVHELGDLRRFPNSKAVACHVGLVPRVANSADKSHHGRLTRRGNREVRWILGQWAVRLLTREPLVQEWARPWLRRMHKNKVRVALAHKLL
ncbi:MAG: IS110 family transposase, partial [Gemmatimonadota bacterium]